LLGVVRVRRGQDIPTATASARALRGRLRALARAVPATVTGEALVRAAESEVAGVRQVAEESGALLVLPLPRGQAVPALAREPYRSLVANPPCDLVLARPGPGGPIRSVLV